MKKKEPYFSKEKRAPYHGNNSGKKGNCSPTYPDLYLCSSLISWTSFSISAIPLGINEIQFMNCQNVTGAGFNKLF
jgi:hypothetical protein